MRKTQRLLALLLVLALLVPCFGAALADDGNGKKTPASVDDVYSIDGVNYYNTYKGNPTQAEKDFEFPEKLLPTMLKANVLDSKGNPIGCNYLDGSHYLDYNYSIADLWMLLGLRANKYSQIHTNKVEISPDAIDTAMFNALHFKNTRKDVAAGYIGKCSDAVYGDSFFSVVNQICATMATDSDGMAEKIPSNLANEIKEKVIKSDADWYNNQDVIGMMNFARYNDQAYGGVLLFFTDFQAVPLLPDSKKPDSYVTIIEKKEPSSKKYASNVKNLTAAAVTASQTVSESWSTTLSSEVSGSEQYSLSTTVSIGETLDLLVAQASINLSLTMGEVIEKGWKESKSTTASESVERTVSVALPPYTNVLLEEGSTETSAITTYNCPVGMKFKVWMYIWEHDGNDFRRAYALFGPDARADLYRRAIRLGTDEYPDGDKMKIQWGKIRESLRYRKDYTEFAAISVPVSPKGATFTENLKTASISVKDIVPTSPLRVVKLEAPNVSFISDQPVSYGNYNYLHADMKVGDSSYTTQLKLSGLNKLGVDYYGFNPLWGEWKVVDEHGEEIKDGKAPVKLELLDKVSKNYRFTAVKPGTCFLKYFINEESYREDAAAYAENPVTYALHNDSLAEGEGWTTNGKLESTAALEITVAENRTIDVTGSYTGMVDKGPEKLEDHGLKVSICDADGKELEELYTWEAKELPAKGISLSADGTVSFSKPGTFHVRAKCTEHEIASDWVEITAIERRPAAVTTAPRARSLTYSGEDQQLVTPGAAEGGTVVYGLGDTLPEDAAFTADIPEAKEAGDYTVWYKARGDETHSDSEAGKVSVTIRQAPVEPVQPNPDELVYNGRAQALVVAGPVEGGTLQYRVDGESEWSDGIPERTDAGEYTVWYRVKGDKNHKDSEPASLKVTIEKKPLLVTAGDAEKTYGDADPVLDCVADGLVGSEKLTGSPARAKGENVGTYAIRQGSLTAGNNYALYFNEGLFEIKPKAIAVKAKDAAAVYGEADPTLEYTVDGLVGSDRLTGRLSRGDGADVGTYPITQGTLAASGNYTLSFEDAVFTITKRALTVAALDASKAYGAADPVLDYTASGLVGQDRLSGSLTRDPGEAPGSYAIRQGSLAASANYEMSFSGGTLTIGEKPALPVAPDFTLLLKMVSAGNASVKLTWTKVKGAQGYDVFFGSCDGDSDLPEVRSLRRTSCTIKKLEKGATYKAYVQAWRKKGSKKLYIGDISPTAHCIVGGYSKRFTNAKSVKLNKSKLTLAVGKKATLKATVKGVKSGRKLLTHESGVRYYSSNANVAKVNSKGKVTAVSAGSCTIYAIANDGVRASVKVKVK